MGLSRPGKECNERLLGQRMTGRTTEGRVYNNRRKRKKKEKGDRMSILILLGWRQRSAIWEGGDGGVELFTPPRNF